jgi:DNA-binding MarR family transcriptional regulator
MQKVISGDRTTVVRAYYELVAVLAKAASGAKQNAITDKEVSILTSIAVYNKATFVLTPGVRGKIQRSLGLSPSALSNHLGRMRRKNLIVEDSGDLRINPLIVPADGPYLFKITLNETTA